MEHCIHGVGEDFLCIDCAEELESVIHYAAEEAEAEARKKTMKIKIEITTDGAAFDDDNRDQEVHRILIQLALASHEGVLEDHVVRDVNGNTCGTVEVIKEGDEES